MPGLHVGHKCMNSTETRAPGEILGQSSAPFRAYLLHEHDDTLRNCCDSSTVFLEFRRNGLVLDPRDIPPDQFQHTSPAAVHDFSIRRLIAAVVGRGIHDPSIWGAISRYPDYFGIRLLIPCPDWTRTSCDVGRRWISEALISRPPRATRSICPDPPAQARGGQPLPVVAGRMSDGMRLLCDRPHGRAPKPSKPGRLSINSPMPADSYELRADASPERFSWEWANHS